MKYRKRLIIYSLLAGLTALTKSCSRETDQLNLLAATSISFPSASAIEYYRDRLYLFGDDATFLLVLDTNGKAVDSLPYWPQNVHRIAKETKPDIESALISTRDHTPLLLGIGSMSDTHRWNVLQFMLDSSRFASTMFFQRGTRFPGIEITNIEGSCLVNHTFVFANRANTTSRKNHLLFWDGQSNMSTRELKLPESEIIAGLSGLYYVAEKDLLLFTASEEDTPNALLDGTIGDSYLGWISRFSHRMPAQSLTPDRLLRLSEADKKLVQQKIESVCVGSVSAEGLTLYLVADNDAAESTLFKMQLRW